MIDTVCLLIPKEKMIYLSGVSSWELYSKTDQYEKYVRNPSKAEKETGKTFPRLTGYSRRFSQEANVRIEFSVPKLLYMNNLDELEDKDFGITKDIYDKKHQEYQDQIQVLEIELSEHSKADYDYQTTVATVLSVARRARTIFDNSSEPARKRAFLNYLLQNPTVDGKKLYFSIASPFNLVLQLADSPNWLRVVDEITTYFRTTSEYHYIPNLKDGIYSLIRPTSKQLAGI
jgi:hypothetical protein